MACLFAVEEVAPMSLQLYVPPNGTPSHGSYAPPAGFW